MLQKILFTDLDGTLLDEATYSFEAAMPAIRSLQERKIPIIFCTSKTFAETIHLQKVMGISDPFIVENGGAVYLRNDQAKVSPLAGDQVGPWQRLSLGVPYRALLAQLATVKSLTGISLRGFSDMNIEEVASLCGLSLEDAERARQREFDEPFSLEAGGEDRLPEISRIVEGVGMTLSRGGRFYHLSGRSDKGRALRALCQTLQTSLGPLCTAGIGDSPNDIPMLEAVDVPMAVMRPDGRHHPVLCERIPGIYKALGQGPEGWCKAVTNWLNNEITQ